jgi:hypothetical protein
MTSRRAEDAQEEALGPAWITGSMHRRSARSFLQFLLMDRLPLPPYIYNLRFLCRMGAIHAAVQREFCRRSSGHGNGCQAIEIAGAPLGHLVQMRIENYWIPNQFAAGVRSCHPVGFAIFSNRSLRENNALPQFRCY